MPPGPRLRRGAPRPRRRARRDRRGQARVAVRGSDRRSRPRRAGSCLRGRRRGGDLGAHRAGALPRLARGPARPRGWRAICRCSARTSCSTPSELIESRAAGADAVLLIAACLSANELVAMLGRRPRPRHGRARRDPRRTTISSKALATDAEVVGVNARDLETLDVDVDAALGASAPHPRRAAVRDGERDRDARPTCGRPWRPARLPSLSARR